MRNQKGFFSPLFQNEKGFTALFLICIAGLAAVLYFIITDTGPFKNKLLSALYPKSASQAATTVNIDANADVHPISQYIYGLGPTGEEWHKTMGMTVSRWGGNQVSRYNWETEDSNSGVDWGLCMQPYLNRSYGAFSNVDYGPSSNSGFSVRDSANGSKTDGWAFLFTVPNAGWVAKDGNNSTCSVNVPGDDGPPVGSQTNDEAAISGYDPTSNRNLTSIKSQMKKGSAFVYPPNKTDGIVYQDELISWLVSQVGRADQGGIKFYAFDNEYDLWSHTHRDIHPAQTGYDALWNKFQTFGTAVKDIDSSAMTTGPVSWGWLQYWTAPLGDADRQAHGNVPLLKWFLRKAKEHETQTGKRILDVLDVHYYPQGGQALSSDVSTNMQALRLRSTRELWDPTYATESWQTCCEGGPNIQIIRKLKQWIAEEYPGTKIGITEWNWGADNHINGGLTIADVLGIFGREDVYLANYWVTPEQNSPGYFAWRMFRNYDGNFGKFGDTSVKADVPATELNNISVYASKDSSTNQMKIMLINKLPSTSQSITLNLANYSAAGTAQVYQYSQANTSQIVKLADITNVSQSTSVSLDPYSIKLIVLSPSGSSSPTPSPTASPSNQTTVTLNTNPAGLQVTFAGQNRTAPYSEQRTPGSSLSIGAPSPQQTNSGFNEVSGQVIMEAESFTQNLPTASHQWNVVSGPYTNFSGNSYLEAAPDNGTNNDLNVSQSPQLKYDVNFTTTGTYYVWIRGRGVNPESDSINVGVDGVLSSTADRIGNLSPNLFEWLNNTTDGPRASIQITSPGKHTINVWMREDGFKFDKILLTTDPSTTFSFLPTGMGPTESAKSTGAIYNFTSWSHGGNQTQNITVPQTNTTYTANFTISATPTPTPTPSPTPTPTPTPSPTPTPPPPAKLGDINGDNQVGILDFAILLSKWNTNDAAADLNDDGTVGMLDFAILLSKWGT